jgi:hypothetical protein
LNEGALNKDMPTQMVEVEYMGANEQMFTIKSIVDRNVVYRFSSTDYRIRSVFLQDAERLTAMTDRFGKPEWKMLGNSLSMDGRDPTSITGQLAVA